MNVLEFFLQRVCGVGTINFSQIRMWYTDLKSPDEEV